MKSRYTGSRTMGLFLGIVGLMLLVVAACSEDPTATPQPTATPEPTEAMMEPTEAMMEPTEAMMDSMESKEAVRVYTSNWSSIELNTRVPAYIIQHGYGYPVEYIPGTTTTMIATFPLGEMDVNMEIWRANILDWYTEQTEAGTIIDLAGTADLVANGARGQILEQSAQGFYVPQYVVDENPGLQSVFDLPDYVELFEDPEDPGKGVLINCIIGWKCQRINRAKWHAYELFDTFNVAEPGSAGALDAAITGAYTAGEPVLAYYWEPTTLVNELDLYRLEEPEWTQECQDTLNEATAERVAAPFNTAEEGCAYPVGDVHSGVHRNLQERAPEVTEFLANVFIGALTVGDLEVWKMANDAEWRDVAIYYLKNNRDVWTSWVTDDNADEIIANVEAALANE